MLTGLSLADQPTGEPDFACDRKLAYGAKRTSSDAMRFDPAPLVPRAYAEQFHKNHGNS